MAFVSDAAANTVRSGRPPDPSAEMEEIGRSGGPDAAGEGGCANVGRVTTANASRAPATGAGVRRTRCIRDQAGRTERQWVSRTANSTPTAAITNTVAAAMAASSVSWNSV
jgi:hypothetical protein